MHTPVFLDQPAVAGGFLRGIAAAREIAVDTEGASFHRFVDRIYLLQLSTREQSAIVDPLTVTGPAIAPLGQLLESADVQTVFHDADYDLRLIFRDYGWRVRNIFDTRIAAQLLGLKAFGLAALLLKYFDVTLDKKHQRADWSMRPLPADMLKYAAHDSMYLLELRDLLQADLRAKGRLEWVREECDRLEGTRWADDDQATAFLRMKGARDLSRRELAVLRELVLWRDSVARGQDRATFRIIGNEQLLELSRVQPSTREDVARVRGVGKGLLEQRWREMLDAMQRGRDVPEADLPKFPKAQRWDRDPMFDQRVAALKAVRDEVAVQLDLDPGVVCARDRMEAVARRNPQNREQLLEVSELRRWQAEILGPGFLKALGV